MARRAEYDTESRGRTCPRGRHGSASPAGQGRRGGRRAETGGAGVGLLSRRGGRRALPGAGGWGGWFTFSFALGLRPAPERGIRAPVRRREGRGEAEPAEQPAPGRLLSAPPSRLPGGGEAAEAGGEEAPRPPPSPPFWPAPRSGEQGGERRGGSGLRRGAADWGDGTGRDGTRRAGTGLPPPPRVPGGSRRQARAASLRGGTPAFVRRVRPALNRRVRWKRGAPDSGGRHPARPR